MRLAIISDVHGNLAALEQVLADLEGRPAEVVVSLGDQVGYGPQPVECLDLLARRGVHRMLGNHELGLIRPEYRSWFNPQALKALMATAGLVGEAEMELMRALPTYMDVDGCRMVHGAPPDSVTTYLFELDDAQIPLALDQASARVCFVGHTHDLELISEQDGRIWRASLAQGEILLDPARRHIVNVGSVGQPRDGTNHAKYALYDTASHRLEIRFVSYDIAATVKMIEERGLPAVYGQRLW